MSVCNVCGGNMKIKKSWTRENDNCEEVEVEGYVDCPKCTGNTPSPDVVLSVEEVKVELTDEEYKTVYEKSDEHGIKNETLRQCVNWFIKDRIKAERERIEKEVEQLENDPNTYEDNNLPEDMIYKFKQIIKGACK